MTFTPTAIDFEVLDRLENMESKFQQMHTLCGIMINAFYKEDMPDKDILARDHKKSSDMFHLLFDMLIEQKEELRDIIYGTDE